MRWTVVQSLGKRGQRPAQDDKQGLVTEKVVLEQRQEGSRVSACGAAHADLRVPSGGRAASGERGEPMAEGPVGS